MKCGPVNQSIQKNPKRSEERIIESTAIAIMSGQRAK